MSKVSDLNIIYTTDNVQPYHLSQAYGGNKLYNKARCKCNNYSCNKCNSCDKVQGCNTITLQDTLDLLARISYKISTLSTKLYNHTVHKHPFSEDEKTSLQRLILFKKSIIRYKNKLIRSITLKKDCVCNSNIQLIFEKAKNHLGVGYSPEKSLHYSVSKNIPVLEDGLIIDDTKFNSWITKNPYCAPVDSWEKLAYYVCGKLNIDIDVEEIKCNLTYEIVRETVPLGVLSGLSIGNLAKKNGYSNKRTNQECKLDWEILVDEVQTCNINYDLYLELIKGCNLSYEVIKEAYSCGLSFSTKNGKYQLVGKNYSYDLSEIDFKAPITSLSQLNLNQDDLTPGHSLDKNKINNLLSDYNLTDKQLRKLK